MGQTPGPHQTPHSALGVGSTLRMNFSTPARVMIDDYEGWVRIRSVLTEQYCNCISLRGILVPSTLQVSVACWTNEHHSFIIVLSATVRCRIGKMRCQWPLKLYLYLTSLAQYRDEAMGKMSRCSDVCSHMLPDSICRLIGFAQSVDQITAWSTGILASTCH
ncbi:hypothetical protein BC629DRAFT_204592 [Irpex lacteus]|nr:hypothetical protein BC629DRAFT_204592 [Irpex lacteus]